MKVAVIGAGIGGLCAAIGLQRSGADVVVYERAPALRAEGSGLSIFGNGARALDALGIGEEFRSIADSRAAAFRGGQRRPDGSWISTLPADAVTQLRVINRSALHTLLTSALLPGTLKTGQTITDVSPQGDLSHTRADGQERHEFFDLIVAADGLRSSTRRRLFNDPGVAYAGYSTWRAITPGPIDLAGEAGETWGVQRRFGIAPLPDGRVYWFGVATTARDQHYDDNVAALHMLFSDWHHPIAQLISATPAEQIHHLPVEELAGHLRSFVSGRVVLLGDAAHAMRPDLGQGGGQAMEDAATLAALVSPFARATVPDHTELSLALKRYDLLRTIRTRRIAQQSRAVGRIAHVPGRTLSKLRDLTLAATPQAALRRQLESVQSWEPPSAA